MKEASKKITKLLNSIILEHKYIYQTCSKEFKFVSPKGFYFELQLWFYYDVEEYAFWVGVARVSTTVTARLMKGWDIDKEVLWDQLSERKKFIRNLTRRITRYCENIDKHFDKYLSETSEEDKQFILKTTKKVRTSNRQKADDQPQA